jgi:DNA-binding CsgD family transcriptional regulator
MYKAKKPKAPQNYWTKLIQEVSTGGHKQHSSQTTPKVMYEVEYERRGMKYTLGEPLTSVYFTQREAECVMQILQGKTMQEAGDSLQLSPRTVEYYLDRIKRKLNCRKKGDIIKLVSQTDFAKNFTKDPYNQKSGRENDDFNV